MLIVIALKANTSVGTLEWNVTIAVSFTHVSYTGASQVGTFMYCCPALIKDVDKGLSSYHQSKDR